MAISITFVCRPYRKNKAGLSPIECSIINKGDRVVFPLEMKCKPEDFRKNSDAQKYCTSVENTLNGIIANLTINNEPPTPHRIKEVFLSGGVMYKPYTLQILFEHMREQKVNENIDTATWRKYENTWELFKEITNHKDYEEVKSITNADILLYEAKIRQNHADTTACKMLKMLKAFFALAIAEGEITKNPFEGKRIGKGRKDGETEWLTYEEIQKVKDLELDSPRLRNVRYCFLWQCFTGQNYSDMAALKKGDVKKDDNNQYYIQKKRSKTGKFGDSHTYTTVLFEDAVQVYWLFGEELPLISNDKYNQYLAELIEMAGIKKTITSRCGRRTFACYLFNTLKITDPAIIQKMMGHENIKQTQEYISVFQNTILETALKASGEKLARDIQSIMG